MKIRLNRYKFVGYYLDARSFHKLRNKKKLTVKYIADKLSMTERNLYLLLDRKYQVKPKHQEIICKLLDCKPYNIKCYDINYFDKVRAKKQKIIDAKIKKLRIIDIEKRMFAEFHEDQRLYRLEKYG